MQRMFSLTVVLLGLTAAHAQTGMQLNDQTSSGTGVAADPLSVATSPLPSSPGSTLGGGATGPVICGPLVPSTDGGSVNVTELAGGGSLNGC